MGKDALGGELGDPAMYVWGFASDAVDVMAVADAMAEPRWYLGRQFTSPPSLHVVLTPIHAPVVDEFPVDFRELAATLGKSGRVPLERRDVDVVGAASRIPTREETTMSKSAMTPDRFAKGMTFDEYAAFVGSPENLGREGFDLRIFSLVRPRVDWGSYLRARHAKARLTDAQAAAIKALAARPDGPAKVFVLSEDWSSDCRRDVPYLARLAEAGGLALRIFTRDGDRMLMKGLPDPADPGAGNADLVVEFANEKNDHKFATVPVAVFYTRDFTELYRYVEYPAIYHKERVIGALRAARAGEAPEQTKERGARDIAELLSSPFFDLWAMAGIDEILSALHEKLVVGAR